MSKKEGKAIRSGCVSLKESCLTGFLHFKGLYAEDRMKNKAPC